MEDAATTELADRLLAELSGGERGLGGRGLSMQPPPGPGHVPMHKEPQEELVLARKGLDGAARLWLWCLLFAVWTPWSRWALLVTLIGCPAVYYGAMLARARAYGLLVQSVFDLYRRRVYRGLGWPAPTEAAVEPAAGQEVTTYLWRGIAPPGMRFATEDDD
ncbi:hypothetical protein [Nonomuraea jabiensis]|uniref:hypothetical protein n=1 Tax=Nonomuraea jabiensis TaxID=882448 RepID=UPI0036B0FED1